MRLWRPEGHPDLLFAEGTYTSCASEPRGEYSVALITGRRMLAHRGRQRITFAPGDLGIWDPGAGHGGEMSDGSPWRCRTMVIEPTGIATDGQLFADYEFPDPKVVDVGLARRFARLFRAFTEPESRLRRDVLLTEWVRDAVRRSPAARPRRVTTRVDQRVLDRARQYLAERSADNIGLDELASAAGTDRDRLVRLFRYRFGVPPHQFQIAQRVRQARHLLERGVSPAEAAVTVGFHDQSHLHRHFTRSLGLTPRAYAVAVGPQVSKRRSL